LQLAASRKALANPWTVAAWKIAHLGSCNLGNCHLESRPWENTEHHFLQNRPIPHQS